MRVEKSTLAAKINQHILHNHQFFSAVNLPLEQIAAHITLSIYQDQSHLFPSIHLMLQ
jgi:hypothetical protein